MFLISNTFLFNKKILAITELGGKKSFKPGKHLVNGRLLEGDISSPQGRISNTHDSRGKKTISLTRILSSPYTPYSIGCRGSMEHQCPNSLHDLVSLETYTLLCGSRRTEEDRQRDTADIVKEFVSLKAKAIEMDLFGIVQRQIW